MRRAVLHVLAPVALALALIPFGAGAETLRLTPQTVPEWKAVYGRIEARDRIPARARLGGTVVALSVAEGDEVAKGQPIATITDEKLAFQLTALTAERDAAAAQLANAGADLARVAELAKQGSATPQRLEALQTQVDVLKGRIAALEASAAVIRQQQRDGVVLAPVSGRVLDVPLAPGAVVLPGETVARLGGGGMFLRLAVPERHAAALHAGDALQIIQGDAPVTGTLARVYPLIENGRVVADVEVPGLAADFVDARVLVRLPVGTRKALLVPQSALVTRDGLDFVAVTDGSGTALRVVMPGQGLVVDGVAMVEILSGLAAGDAIETGGASHD